QARLIGPIASDPIPLNTLETAAITDSSGNFVFPNVLTGEYDLVVPDHLESGIGNITFPNITSARCRLTVSGDVVVPDIIYRSGVLIDSIGNQFRQIGEAASTIASIIPTAAQTTPTTQGAIPGVAGGLAYDQIVDANISKVLGASSSSDPQRILGLLNS